MEKFFLCIAQVAFLFSANFYGWVAHAGFEESTGNAAGDAQASQSSSSTSGIETEEKPVIPLSESNFQDADGSQPEQKIFQLLNSLGIAFSNHVHEPLFTVADAQKIHSLIPGAHIKNLFFKSKKGKFVLLVMLDARALDLKQFQTQLGAGSLSFASAEALQEKLQLSPGSVTPLALMHDSAKGIDVVLDDQIIHQYEVINCHPLRNDRTISIQVRDFLKFIEKMGFEPKILTLPKK